MYLQYKEQPLQWTNRKGCKRIFSIYKFLLFVLYLLSQNLPLKFVNYNEKLWIHRKKISVTYLVTLALTCSSWSSADLFLVLISSSACFIMVAMSFRLHNILVGHLMDLCFVWLVLTQDSGPFRHSSAEPSLDCVVATQKKSL